MKGAVTYGSRTISYVVVANQKLTTKVRIHVHPTGIVEVEAPIGRSPNDVAGAVAKRGRWLSEQISSIENARCHVLVREYVNGETHFYLGRRYVLKITVDASSPPAVSLKGGHLRVSVRKADPAEVQRVLNAWYRERAEQYFAKRLAALSENIRWVKAQPPIKLKRMRNQWGSCSPSGSINLNPWLIRAPRDCIDYVIVHELCHLREHNHSKRYYALLDRQMPRWRPVKARLDNMAELLLAA